MEYKIEIFSRGVEAGIGNITEAQYKHWADMDDSDLGEALNQNYDYDENETPEDARFDYYYNDYSDVLCACGPELESSTLVITDANGVEVYNGDLSGFFNEEDETLDNVEEFSCTHLEDLGSGYYVYWAQGGKGTYFSGMFEAETFDPKLLKMKYESVEGMDIVNCVEYADQEVSDDGGDWWGKWADYRVHHVE